jgi:exopolysaccharide biosynthesis polyprenyl glycosylphosphotransferase
VSTVDRVEDLPAAAWPVAAGPDALTSEILRQRAARSSFRRGWMVRRALLAADVLGLFVSFIVATHFFGSAYGASVDEGVEALVFATTLPLWILLIKLHGLYDADEAHADHSTVDEAVGVFHVLTVATWLFVIVTFATGVAHPSLSRLAAFWALALLIVPTARVVARLVCRRSVAYLQNTLIVGAGDVGQLVARKVQKHPEYGLNLLGFVDSSPKRRRGDLGEASLLGSVEDLPGLVRSLDVERVVIAFSNDSHHQLVPVIRSLNDLDVQIDVVPRLFEVMGPRVGIHTVEAVPLLVLPPARLSPSSRLLKRTLDIVVGSILLLLTLPLMLVVAALIRYDSQGPALFRQKRLGQNMREFELLKFRTMRTDVDDAVHREYIEATMTSDAAAGSNGMYKLERADAITRVGRWLRKTSLDELPQLLNVLRGDMSLVGPRPCLEYETKHFEQHHFDRFLVPAGITGLWQVSARAASTFGEALDMDVAYARGWSLGLDIRLLCRTPLQVLRQRKATA